MWKKTEAPKIKKKKVCVIGAGTAGLCAGRYTLENDMKLTIYEQTNSIGGTWNFSKCIGTNSYGLDTHSSMYQGLRTNLPKEIMGFPNFPIVYNGHSYVPSNVIQDYLERYANHFKLRRYIKKLHYVIRVLFKNNLWEVTVKNLQTNVVKQEYYDFILVCNGHYSTPFCPKIIGLDLFKGKVIHSHDYRFLDPFQDEIVLVIGSGPSGIDICNELCKVATKVLLSHHMDTKIKIKFSRNVLLKPDVIKLNDNGAFFEDGSYELISVLFFCTGFKYTFPFLNINCGIHVEENHVTPLYKHVLNIQHPTMAIIGIPFYVCAAQMIDLQLRFVFEYFSQRKQQISAHQMFFDTNVDIEQRLQRGLKKRQAHMMGTYQKKYYDDVAKTAEIEPLQPVISKLHDESSDRFIEDITNFRNDIYYIIDDQYFIQYK